MNSATMPTLPVLVLKHWAGGNLEPGDRAALPLGLARRLETLGAVEVIVAKAAAPVDAAPVAPTASAPVVMAEPPQRRRKR